MKTESIFKDFHSQNFKFFEVKCMSKYNFQLEFSNLNFKINGQTRGYSLQVGTKMRRITACSNWELYTHFRTSISVCKKWFSAHNITYENRLA